MRKKKLFIIAIFLTYVIYPEERVEYQKIRELIKSGQFNSAQTEIDSLHKKGIEDATLTYYQTEIWVERAKVLYSIKKYKSSFEYYKKAYENWPSHPDVRKRYFELKNKKLVDQELEIDPVDPRVTEIENRVNQTFSGDVFLLDSEMLKAANKVKDALVQLEKSILLKKDQIEKESIVKEKFSLYEFLQIFLLLIIILLQFVMILNKQKH